MMEENFFCLSRLNLILDLDEENKHLKIQFLGLLSSCGFFVCAQISSTAFRRNMYMLL